MPQEIIYYLLVAFAFWVVIFAIEYWTEDEVTLADLLFDGVLGLLFPITALIIILLLIGESKKIVLKKKKKT